MDPGSPGHYILLNDGLGRNQSFKMFRASKQNLGPCMFRTTLTAACLLLFALFGTAFGQDGSSVERFSSSSTIPLPPGQAEAAIFANQMASELPDMPLDGIENTSPPSGGACCGDSCKRPVKRRSRPARRKFATRFSKRCGR